MEQREESGSGGAAGCLVAVVAAGTAFGVWLHGAEPGLRGAFEGERDMSLLYADLPCMLVGIPVVTLAARALTHLALTHLAPRGRSGRAARGVLSGAVVVVVLVVLARVCLAWLDARVEWVSPES